MSGPNTEIWEEIKKYMIVAFWALLGVAAKLTNLNKEKKLTKGQALSTLGAGVFAGFVASNICESYGIQRELTSAIISISALSGEHVVGWFMTNSTDLLNWLKKILMRKK